MFTNQVAVVTGASSGIGKAIAAALGAEDATLCLLGRHVEGLQLTAPRTVTFTLDLAEETPIREIAAKVRKDFGGVDILVHSAGIYVPDQEGDGAAAGFALQEQVNVRAPSLLTQELLPALQSRRGQAVFINSSVVYTKPTGLRQYSATKTALKNFADQLRDQVNPAGVRVLSVFPGRTATPMQAAFHQLQGKEYHPERLLQPEDVASMVVHALGLPRTAEVTEIDIRPMQKT